MQKIRYIERSTGEERVEKVYGDSALRLMYGESLFSRFFSKLFLPAIAKWPWFSKLYGYCQKMARSRKKIRPFIETYEVDETEFADPVDSFRSFNDFFIRKLKPSCRPIAEREDAAILPADGRYLVYPDLGKVPGFFVKGQEFALAPFLGSGILARRFQEGSMVMGRLCPSDYHRFHFPCDGYSHRAAAIPGSLFSVNPFALRRRLSILWENKRFVTEIDSPQFGTVLYVEIGATAVGTVHQTYKPNGPIHKGEEKGYFSFGGSCVVLLFEKGRIQFEPDLILNSSKFLETRARFGEVLGYGRR